MTSIPASIPFARHGQEGPQVLWLHGLDGPGPDQEAIVALAQTCRVIVPTMPGFDDARRPEAIDTVDDLVLGCLELIEREQLTAVTVVGHSFGGWIAAEMAVWRPARIARLVLIDALGVRVGGRTDRDIADLFVIGAAERRELMFADPGKSGPLPAELGDEDLLRRMHCEEAVALYGWEPYLCNPKLLARLATVTLPTRVIWGAQDGIVSPDYGRAFAEALPNSTFELVENAGHCPHIEQPSRVLDLITDAIAGRAPTAQA